jgi:hypothetical protein
MTEPEILLPEEPETDDDLRPNRASGQSDPWHGLDDFEDENVQPD